MNTIHTPNNPPRPTSPHLAPTSRGDLKIDLAPPSPSLRGRGRTGAQPDTTNNPPPRPPKKGDLNTTHDHPTQHLIQAAHVARITGDPDATLALLLSCSRCFP
ncbi:hypothetical protein NPS01_25280 [Nocardioides psychrotolerans]|uniref:Uncharacterized protein n=1 Tax=Nocardioides psychrotolerans TaxID=1005945 RepID=A0A1I3LMU3_9ACTN|nr:hypothetical protein NPS01_25280 [Nocardioides psychrotolerans]SFI86027.1 hypothetical protein SAMN05216561_11432 [Nocardioides psychrotolerans]